VDVWWIWKEDEEVDPEWTSFSREDVLYVVQGTLRVELRDAPAVVLEAGDLFVIPAGAAFRGYRWPRDATEPCLFVAVTAAGAETRKDPAREDTE
jgi:quercetin dioxygenase-like cupin family protein